MKALKPRNCKAHKLLLQENSGFLFFKPFSNGGPQKTSLKMQSILAGGSSLVWYTFPAKCKKWLPITSATKHSKHHQLENTLLARKILENSPTAAQIFTWERTPIQLHHSGQMRHTSIPIQSEFRCMDIYSCPKSIIDPKLMNHKIHLFINVICLHHPYKELQEIDLGMGSLLGELGIKLEQNSWGKS